MVTWPSIVRVGEMVMAPILVVAALNYPVEYHTAQQAGECKHIGPYRVALRVLWNERFVAWSHQCTQFVQWDFFFFLFLSFSFWILSATDIVAWSRR